LGAGALAGNAFGVDRAALAQALGFEGITANSIDAVADRDFVVEFLFWASLFQVHMSRLAEDMVFWSSAEYGFISLDEAFSTGSSIMPQKRNPDSMELLRGKAGRLVGNLVGLLTVLKGIPTAYDKDLQEDKEGLLDTLRTLNLAIPVATGAIDTMTANSQAMKAALDDGMLATDLADYLVRKGVPFRESHGLVGQAVRLAESRGAQLGELDLDDYRAISDAFDADVFAVFDFAASVERRNCFGGTSTSAVMEQIALAHDLIDKELKG
jgi:argininosuccinate lyase